jgi:large subunit ribosomal protein L3
VPPRRHLVELRTDAAAEYEVGQEVGADVFEAGTLVDVVGTSKGKGTAGVMKRHGFAGLGAGHGTQRKHRSPGSIGACATPARVFKGLRMAGRMGNVRTTTLSLTVHAVDADKGLLLIKGAIPGPTGGLVLVRSAVKGGAR